MTDASNTFAVCSNSNTTSTTDTRAIFLLFITFNTQTVPRAESNKVIFFIYFFPGNSYIVLTQVIYLPWSLQTTEYCMLNTGLEC